MSDSRAAVDDGIEAKRPDTSLFQDASAVWWDIAGAARETLDLAALEGRLAATSVVWMLVWGVVAIVLLLSVWTLLMFALAVSLTRMGMAVELAVCVVTAANGGLALIAWVLIQRLSRNLSFAASRRQIARQQEETNARQSDLVAPTD